MKLVVWLPVITLLVGCAAKEPVQQQPGFVLGKPICSAWVHDSIANSTADFQACRFNNQGKQAATDSCMKQRGWRREVSENACRIYSYTYAQRQQCIDYALVDNRVDHEKMAQCLSQYTPKLAKPLDPNVLRQLINQCMTKPTSQAQESCLNQALQHKGTAKQKQQ